MDRQFTLCVLVPAERYQNYIEEYNNQSYHYNKQQQQLKQHHQQQKKIYENSVSQYQMKMCYHNDYENDEEIQQFYWEQCYRQNCSDAEAFYYCEYVSRLVVKVIFFHRY